MIEALAVHAVDYNAEAKARFGRAVRSTGAHLVEAGDPAEAVALSGDLIHALQAYNQTAESFLRNHGRELQSVVLMLTKSMSRFCGNVETASGNLHDLERQIEGASSLEDIRAVKGRLAEQLGAVQAHMAAEKEEFADLKMRVEQSVERAQAQAALPVDPATGLGSAQQAEKVLAAIQPNKSNAYVAVFVIERMEAINSRFGFSAGDEMLMTAAQHINTHLGSGAEVFRWRGPALVAVLERNLPLEGVRLEVAKMASIRPELTLQKGARSVLLTIEFTWTVMPSGGASQLPLATRVNQFLAQKTARPRSSKLATA